MDMSTMTMVGLAVALAVLAALAVVAAMVSMRWVAAHGEQGGARRVGRSVAWGRAIGEGEPQRQDGAEPTSRS